jgi:hypothetical protein
MCFYDYPGYGLDSEFRAIANLDSAAKFDMNYPITSCKLLQRKEGTSLCNSSEHLDPNKMAGFACMDKTTKDVVEADNSTTSPCEKYAPGKEVEALKLTCGQVQQYMDLFTTVSRCPHIRGLFHGACCKGSGVGMVAKDDAYRLPGGGPVFSKKRERGKRGVCYQCNLLTGWFQTGVVKHVRTSHQEDSAHQSRPTGASLIVVFFVSAYVAIACVDEMLQAAILLELVKHVRLNQQLVKKESCAQYLAYCVLWLAHSVLRPKLLIISVVAYILSHCIREAAPSQLLLGAVGAIFILETDTVLESILHYQKDSNEDNYEMMQDLNNDQNQSKDHTKTDFKIYYRAKQEQSRQRMHAAYQSTSILFPTAVVCTGLYYVYRSSYTHVSVMELYQFTIPVLLICTSFCQEVLICCRAPDIHKDGCFTGSLVWKRFGAWCLEWSLESGSSGLVVLAAIALVYWDPGCAVNQGCQPFLHTWMEPTLHLVWKMCVRSVGGFTAAALGSHCIVYFIKQRAARSAGITEGWNPGTTKGPPASLELAARDMQSNPGVAAVAGSSLVTNQVQFAAGSSTSTDSGAVGMEFGIQHAIQIRKTRTR